MLALFVPKLCVSLGWALPATDGKLLIPLPKLPIEEKTIKLGHSTLFNQGSLGLLNKW